MDCLDQTARSVQSDLDVHCPQKLPMSSPEGKELIIPREKPFQNIMGKGENAGYHYCLLFPPMFFVLSETNLSYGSHSNCRLQMS